MFYAIIAGKIWSIITSITQDNFVYSFGIFISLFLFPLFSLLRRQRSNALKNDIVELPDIVSNQISLGLLRNIFIKDIIQIHSISSRIISKSKQRWHLSVFMAKIEMQEEYYVDTVLLFFIYVGIMKS